MKGFDPDIFRLDTTGRSPALFLKGGILPVDAALIARLKDALSESGEASLRLCLHADASALHHDMIIVQRLGQRSKAHHHPRKDETLHVIEGRLGLTFLGDDGGVEARFELTAGNLLRLPCGRRHVTEALSDFTVFHESAAGPHDEGDTVR